LKKKARKELQKSEGANFRFLRSPQGKKIEGIRIASTRGKNKPLGARTSKAIKTKEESSAAPDIKPFQIKKEKSAILKQKGESAGEAARADDE